MSYVLRALCALVPHVPRVLRALVAHLPCALRALVPHLYRDLRALELPVPLALCAIILYERHTLRSIL